MEDFSFKHGLTWSSFDAYISDTASPGNLIWPVSKSPKTDLSTGHGEFLEGVYEIELDTKTEYEGF
jgi:hypothetical protein